MEKKKPDPLKKKMSHIKGWAHDADPDDQPNYPMKDYTGDDHNRLDYRRPPRQRKMVEILQSTEHKRTPATFGTSNPPKGLSGVIRRQAYNYSENMLRHWLLLLLADRVDAMEGLLEDVINGTPPRWGKERGFDAMWEHDRQLLIRRVAFRVAIYGAVAGAIAYQVLKNKKTRALVRGRGPEFMADQAQ
jgi:hypothetical protein